jgi:PAS domain S-box-containing protein
MAQTSADDGIALPRHGSAADPAPLKAGWFRFYFADERWEWSDEVAEIHGYESGSVTPPTDLVMSHKHPDDHAKMAAHLDDVRRTHKPVSTRHRIVDAQGRTPQGVVAGQQIVDDDGQVVGATGFYIDVTPTPGTPDDTAKQQAISEGIASVVAGRTIIDQIKGMLMLIYGIDAEKAFGLLKWRSQATNVKLRALAQ